MYNRHYVQLENMADSDTTIALPFHIETIEEIFHQYATSFIMHMQIYRMSKNNYYIIKLYSINYYDRLYNVQLFSSLVKYFGQHIVQLHLCLIAKFVLRTVIKFVIPFCLTEAETSSDKRVLDRMSQLAVHLSDTASDMSDLE